MQTPTHDRSAAGISLREVIHRVNNLTATMLAESELALLGGEPEGQARALRRVVEIADRLRLYLRDVQRREEESSDRGGASAP